MYIMPTLYVHYVYCLFSIIDSYVLIFEIIVLLFYRMMLMAQGYFWVTIGIVCFFFKCKYKVVTYVLFGMRADIRGNFNLKMPMKFSRNFHVIICKSIKIL